MILRTGYNDWSVKKIVDHHGNLNADHATLGTIWQSREHTLEPLHVMPHLEVLVQYYRALAIQSANELPWKGIADEEEDQINYFVTEMLRSARLRAPKPQQSQPLSRDDYCPHSLIGLLGIQLDCRLLGVSTSVQTYSMNTINHPNRLSRHLQLQLSGPHIHESLKSVHGIQLGMHLAHGISTPVPLSKSREDKVESEQAFSLAHTCNYFTGHPYNHRANADMREAHSTSQCLTHEERTAIDPGAWPAIDMARRVTGARASTDTLIEIDRTLNTRMSEIAGSSVESKELRSLCLKSRVAIVGTLQWNRNGYDKKLTPRYKDAIVVTQFLTAEAKELLRPCTYEFPPVQVISESEPRSPVIFSTLLLISELTRTTIKAIQESKVFVQQLREVQDIMGPAQKDQSPRNRSSTVSPIRKLVMMLKQLIKIMEMVTYSSAMCLRETSNTGSLAEKAGRWISWSPKEKEKENNEERANKEIRSLGATWRGCVTGLVT